MTATMVGCWHCRRPTTADAVFSRSGAGPFCDQLCRDNWTDNSRCEKPLSPGEVAEAEDIASAAAMIGFGANATPEEIAEGQRVGEANRRSLALEMVFTPVENRCMDPSGCDAPGTVFIEYPNHWHDFIYCAEHAPKESNNAEAAQDPMGR